MNFTIQQAIIPTLNGYTTVDVQIEGEQIKAISTDSPLPPRGTVIDGRKKLLLPGFVNGHTHSSEMWQRGLIPPYPLELWLGELHEFTPPNPEQIYLSALGTAVETLLSGGTCVVDHLVLIPGKEVETVAAAVKAYQEIGIRAYIGPLIQDQSMSEGIPSGGTHREHEAYYCSTEEVLGMMQTVVDRFHQPEAGMNIMVAPTGIQLCSDGLFAGCMELSDRNSLCRHAHLLETKAQQLLAHEKYAMTAVQYLDKIGYLNPRTSLAHCIWLEDQDIAILAKTGATVVHNPLSNLRLGSGIAPILKYRQAGINVAFGCDGAASNDGQDLLEAIKIGSMLHNITDRDYQHWITPRESVEMAALGGVTGLGMEDQLGTLTEGKMADLVLYDLTNLSLLPKTDPIGLLVMGRPTQVVDRVWVRGEEIIAQGQPTRIDLKGLREALLQYGDWTTTRQSNNIAQLEQHYRQVMDLPK
ncbi:amidohydrolase [Spirulina sp. CS-785/01]|uniref:amidohydrolase n=1 Tax=Spirulina sp. CS-785/01 TaxID=3021716 RepID=UPI00232C71FC|nr:amidohydrolase [Spirulina sp. CS-785/01]MDB9312636.1 amidohydrolase [Spirulina sp. CS-785/01]